MSKSSGLGKFLVGAGIGVGLGLLFAPKPGSETRKELVAKFNELMEEVKKIDVNEVRDEMLAKVEELKEELADLDKEKVIAIAKDKGEEIKVKAQELIDLSVEKGTPYVEKAAKEVKKEAIATTKKVLKKLEESEK